MFADVGMAVRKVRWMGGWTVRCGVYMDNEIICACLYSWFSQGVSLLHSLTPYMPALNTTCNDCAVLTIGTCQ